MGICTDISTDISIDISMDIISVDIPMDISMDIPMDISIDILKTLVNPGGAVARSGDHAKGAVRGQRMLPKRGRAVMTIAWEPEDKMYIGFPI